MDAPRLRDISLTMFSQPKMDTSQLGRFIERIEIQTSLTEASVRASADSISICFSKPGAPTRVELRISSEQSSWQLSSMTQICNYFPPFLSRVENLGINATCRVIGQDDVGGGQWLDLIRAFGSAKDLRVAGEQRNLRDIFSALDLADGAHRTDTPVLPALRNLRIEQIVAVDGQLWDAVQSFITLRWLSGRPVEVYAREYSCRVCFSKFTEQQELELKRHLLDKHSYLLVCIYCSDFECKPGYNDRFREHLATKHPLQHPELAHTDTLISGPALQSYSGSHGTQCIDLRALDAFGPLTKLKAPAQLQLKSVPMGFPVFIDGHFFGMSEMTTNGGSYEDMELWFDPDSIQDDY
ncbi:hypothetical protein EDB87DRAFT_1619106 [Lactarius vividus]|nr:hypothetical protein EDB87DRAFT_1619106 [Lactarius vividus]